MEKIGCTTPFGPYKDNICQNKTKALMAHDLFANYDMNRNKTCGHPCTYIGLGFFKTKELKKSSIIGKYSSNDYYF